MLDKKLLILNNQNMYLGLIFVILFLNFSKIITKYCSSVGQLTKDNSIEVKETKRCVYLDTNEFGKSGDVKLKVTAYFSFFMEDKMYYRGSDTLLGYDINLNNYKSSDSYSTSNPYYVENANVYYYESTYYFTIPLSITQRYLYISVPDASMYARNHKTIIKVEQGLSTGAIIGIIFAVIALIAIAIIAFIWYRKKKNLGSISSLL